MTRKTRSPVRPADRVSERGRRGPGVGVELGAGAMVVMMENRWGRYKHRPHTIVRPSRYGLMLATAATDFAARLDGSGA